MERERIRSIPVGTGNPFGRPLFGALKKVYPRGHGESLWRMAALVGWRGLSPWARGILRGGRGWTRYRGSIPVGTGNPRSA